MKNNQKWMLKSLMLTLLATLFLLSGANAQELLRGRFSLPSQIRWGNAVLAPGDYTFKVHSMPIPGRITVQTADGSKSFMIVPDSRDDVMPGGSFIRLTGENELRIVRSLNLPQLGFAMIYPTPSTRQKEGQIQVRARNIPVAVAKK